MGYRVQSESDAYLIGTSLRYAADQFERDAETIKRTGSGPRTDASFRMEAAMREQARRARKLANDIEGCAEA